MERRPPAGLPGPARRRPSLLGSIVSHAAWSTRGAWRLRGEVSASTAFLGLALVEDRDRFYLHAGVRLDEPRRPDERHRREVLAEPGAPERAEGRRRAAVGVEVGHVDREL